MAKEFFKSENMTALRQVAGGGRIHLIGICGVAMGQLAVQLKAMGYLVSGSDKEFYEPMGSFLERSKVDIRRGYKAENVPSDADLVVIGNAASYGNPEVSVVENKNLPYTCFPKLLCETIIAGKHSIVIAGTHGKSTTSAITATLLRAAGRDPSYFIGGVVEGFETSLHRGQGDISVVEGDEYDDVFFSKKAKFTHYSPDTLVINAIEYDHADLYPDVESIKAAFLSGVDLVPSEGKIVACTDFPLVTDVLGAGTIRAKIVTFGTTPLAEYRIVSRKTSGMSQEVCVDHKGREIKFDLPAIGEYNARNALAALLAISTEDQDLIANARHLASFRSVKRRQEVRFNANGVVLIEDFAHHPTAVLATLSGVRDVYPDKTLWAVFEPRSNTSRRKVFEAEYLKSFAPAQNVVISHVTPGPTDAGQELIDVGELAQNITKNGIPAIALPDASSICSHIMREIKENDVIVIMSNGSFGGLPGMLEKDLKARFAAQEK